MESENNPASILLLSVLQASAGAGGGGGEWKHMFAAGEPWLELCRVEQLIMLIKLVCCTPW